MHVRDLTTAFPFRTEVWGGGVVGVDDVLHREVVFESVLQRECIENIAIYRFGGQRTILAHPKT